MGRVKWSALRFHYWATVVWATVGSFTTWWFPGSIPWIAFMSLYANIVGHWAAYQAAKAEKTLEK